MPYIAPADREAIDGLVVPPQTPGELNYKISAFLLHMNAQRESGVLRLIPYGEIGECVRVMCHQYLASVQVRSGVGLRYGQINEVVGVLACARMEMLRRITPRRAAVFDNFAKVLAAVASDFYAEVAAPYEDLKIQENGDLPYVS